jgi:hypothetical protein
MRIMHLAATGLISLTIAFSPGNGAAVHHWTLRCGPPGGTLPQAAAACRRLQDFTEDPFAPVPPDTICTAIYGGPQTARVTGTYRGQKVNAVFNRRNGCEIARWKRLSFLFR